jgi:SAM-dependent methyltransferase
MTYTRFASLTWPLVVLALGFFVFMQVTQKDCPTLDELEGHLAQAAAETRAHVNKGVERNPNDTKAAFEAIYANSTWGTNASGAGTSGSGSTLDATYLYRDYLEHFIKKYNIKSVVDAGCGDWEFSSQLDWTGIDYKGFDIVAKVIEADKAKYGKPNIQFFTGNIVEDDLPPADLLISKHVLQHLPNADVKKFLDKQLKKYKHVLLTNGVHEVLLTGNNADIKPGEYRLLELMRPPFDVQGRKVLTWWANGHMHQVLHVNNDKKPASPK